MITVQYCMHTHTHGWGSHSAPWPSQSQTSRVRIARNMHAVILTQPKRN